MLNVRFSCNSSMGDNNFNKISLTELNGSGIVINFLWNMINYMSGADMVRHDWLITCTFFDAIGPTVVISYED